MARSDEQQAGDEDLREIADKVRDLARQTPIPEAQQELFDLADRLDRMADLARLTRGRGRGGASDADHLDCRMSRAGAVDLAGRSGAGLGALSTPLPARLGPAGS